MLNSTPLSPIFNAATSVSQHRAAQRTAEWDISVSGDKNPFVLVLEVLNKLRATQQQLVKAAENDVGAQQAHMQPSPAEKALSQYEAQWNTVMQLMHQLNNRILDAIR